MNHNPWRTALVTAAVLTLVAAAILFILNMVGDPALVTR